MRTGKSAPSNALSHVQNDPTSEVELSITGAGSVTNLYGFLVEEPNNDPLYIIFTDDSDNILISFESSAKFGRDGQTFALKNSANGLKAKLSTTRASVTAPAAGATFHVWYSALARS